MQDRVIIDELRGLETTHGILRPSDVVDAARPDHSPMHGQFEWNDSVAGHKYRLDQARALIRVCVEYIGEPKRRREVFVSLTTDRHANGGYRSLVNVLRIDRMKAQLIEDARLDMDRFVGRYSHIVELASVVEAMQKAQSKLKQAKPVRHKKAS